MLTFGIGIGIGFLANNNPHPTAPSYELQQKCTKDAEDLLIKARGDKIPGALFGLGAPQKQSVVKLQHHYSSRLNRCFVKLHTKLWWIDPNNNKENVDTDQLAIWDVNDYERGPDAVLRGWPSRDKPGYFTVESCWATNDLEHFDECDHGDILGTDIVFRGIADKWNALTKPFMQE